VLPGSFADAGDATAPSTTAPRPAAAAAPATLPAWTYRDAGFHARERELLFRPSWQIVCHVSELAEPGDYVTLDFAGWRAFAVRDGGGAVRAFHNVCRHRAHAVVEGDSGRCPGVIRCPYHSWTYGLDGRLRAIAEAKTFGPVDKERFGLGPLDCEVFHGFVFVRFESAGASVAARLAPFAAELSHYRLAEMQPLGPYWHGETGVDWKNVWDNYLEHYHFPSGHPGLSALMGPHYETRVEQGQVARLSHTMVERRPKGWSPGHYRAILPDYEHLPPELRRRWSYVFLFPGIAFDLYPDRMDFFQVIPTGPGRSTLRGRAYGLADSSRATRAARYLNRRINWQVHCEDVRLTRSVQQGLESGAYTVGILSQKESVARAFQSWVREAVGMELPPQRPHPLSAHPRAIGDPRPPDD
jgi:phenylpropionate dioxygenase-like ring-hydroxylating dioxygenase large terminal subunit